MFPKELTASIFRAENIFGVFQAVTVNITDVLNVMPCKIFLDDPEVRATSGFTLEEIFDALKVVTIKISFL
jgi:hypothetical protein